MKKGLFPIMGLAPFLSLSEFGISFLILLLDFPLKNSIFFRYVQIIFKVILKCNGMENRNLAGGNDNEKSVASTNYFS